MTIDEAREWLQRHADNTPMPGAREAYRTILEALGGENCQDEKMDSETAIRLLRFERSERYPELPGFLRMRDAMEMAINALERTRWIPVQERLPEKRRMVLLHFESGYELVGCLANNYREQNCWAARKINSPGLEIVVDPDYWMLLPEPPGVE